MPRIVGVVLALVVGILVVLLVRKPGGGRGTAVVDDPEALVSLEPAVVVQNCGNARFDESNASAPVEIEPGVIIRVIPNIRGHENKLEHLQRGRVLAKIRNEGTVPYLPLAVGAKEESCWAVRYDDDRGLLISKFVSLSSSNQTEDENFHIDLHPTRHNRSYAEWRQISAGAASGPTPVQLAGTGSSRQDSALVADPWMWVSCLSNGCCRTRR
jgi:hypothetical protein